MNIRKEILPALGAAAMALALDVASGRAVAAFYGQMAGASWAGVLLSGLILGTMTGLVCALAQPGDAVGAPSLALILHSRLIQALYALLLLAAGCALAFEAGHIGALVLPMHRAGAYAGLIACSLAAALALTSGRAVYMLGACYAAALGIYLAALLVFGRMPEGGMHYAVELRLGNSLVAALLLASVHGAMGVCLSAGLAAKPEHRVHPVGLGAISGLSYTLLLLLGNAVLQRQESMLLRLRYPFAALAAGWGRGGFYLSALMIFLGCVTGLSGILYAVIPKRKSRISGEN